MEIKAYVTSFLSRMKNTQEKILSFLDSDQNREEDLQVLLRYFQDQKICEDKVEFKALLHLISKISNNYHRSTNFICKIEQILKNLQEKTKNYFSNYDIFHIFKNNKRILLFLFEEKVIIPDKSILSQMTKHKFKFREYIPYFYPEFESFFDDQLKQEIKSQLPEDMNLFEQKRKIGQNDSEICRLIRNDSIDDFIKFVNQNNYPLDYEIEKSIYETNNYLTYCFPTLIEYSAFFGSVKIFKYLITNGANLGASLMSFSSHGNNSEIIHILEEKQIEIADFDYYESIKCHSIDVSNYLKQKLNDVNGCSQCLHYYNFIELENQINDFGFNFFYDCCRYDYISIVDFLLKNSKIEINSKVTSNISFNFLNDASIFFNFFVNRISLNF
ncbi:hypothetical protein M9Y10_037104 [Tritrichomonas musculus]|uniref:DUF3447 domain-containing protein n=1 Tax=Tritrichomonas musculus TaxID=1915356 RepID=A0ABR2GT07_9EUKA